MYSGTRYHMQLAGQFRGLTDFILREMVKTGTTVQSLKYAEFEQQPFPLPPLAEQHRIVAKVDALMALCARLEAARASRSRIYFCSSTIVATPRPKPPMVFRSSQRKTYEWDI
jgi:Type I restriction modification DNA specificity domain